MTARPESLSDDLLRDIAERHGTPVYVYCWSTIERQVERLRAFDSIRYAQKANSNLALLRRLRTLGVRVDAVSLGELERALRAGFDVADVQFTADVLDRSTADLLGRLDVSVNCGSADMIEQYVEARRDGARQPLPLTLRVNPGFGHGHGLKVSTGGPLSKHGIWHEELPSAIRRAQAKGVEVEGLHVHIGSGSDFLHLSRVRDSMRRAAGFLGDSLRTLSVGGGLPTPYRAEDEEFDVDRFAEAWLETRELVELEVGHAVHLEVEPGRYLLAQSGVLLAEVRARKRAGESDFVLVDAGFDNLLRPAMYGAFHGISRVRPPVGAARGEEPPVLRPRLVSGPLCESADTFTQGQEGVVQPRELPEMNLGDLVCFHDVGAYASSMASNYNSRMLAPEVLVVDRQARLVRRRQDLDHLLALEVPESR